MTNPQLLIDLIATKFRSGNSVPVERITITRAEFDAALSQPAAQPALAPIDHDAAYNRYYIPLPGGWEVQTKGGGSSFRIADTKHGGDRFLVPDSPYLHEHIERMARQIHAACSKPAAPDATIAWEATTIVYTRFITQAKYGKLSNAMRRWYKPYRCSSCNAHAPQPVAFDLVAHLERQREFSLRTFGPGARTAGVCDHIRKELAEIEADPADLKEWVDVILLALDGAWRAGHEPANIAAAIAAKQTKNEGRTWPDWRTADPNKAIEHDRSADIQELIDLVTAKFRSGNSIPVERITITRAEWEAIAPLLAAQPAADWTNEQCVEFMRVGLRHARYSKDSNSGPLVGEIREGARAANALAVQRETGNPVSEQVKEVFAQPSPARATEVHTALADAAIGVLMDRGGFDGWWGTVDEETSASILISLAETFAELCPAQTVGPTRCIDCGEFMGSRAACEACADHRIEWAKAAAQTGAPQLADALRKAEAGLVHCVPAPGYDPETLHIVRAALAASPAPTKAGVPEGHVLIERNSVSESAAKKGVEILQLARSMGYGDKTTAMMIFVEMLPLAAAPTPEVKP